MLVILPSANMLPISDHTCYMLLYSANLVFIVTHLYGWVLKWFYRPKAYSGQFRELFPAYRSVGALYLMQALELPYLFNVGDPDALIYVNSFALLVFSLQMLIICESYFYSASAVNHLHRYSLLYIPVAVILIPLFLQAVGLVSLPDGYRPWVFAVVTPVFALYFWLSIRMALRIGRTVRQVNEAEYADDADFPVRLAVFFQWVPTLVCLLLAAFFYADSPILKAVHDVLFIFIGGGFCIFTLNPWRKVFTPQEEEIIEQIGQTDTSSFRVGDELFGELSNRLNDLLVKDLIFTEPHITIDLLMQRMGTNANYLSEVIRRSGYSSFYDMICQHRVNHAIRLIKQQPDEKLLVIADQCGFSSSSSMTKAFKQQGKEPPSKYRS